MIDISLKDKNGIAITVGNKDIDDDVLFNGEHNFRIYEHIHADNAPSNIEMISCTGGYMHAVTQEHLANFERIGKYSDNTHLFECD